MTFSLNEIEVMSKRAARGAGLSWGLAEEAGKAARWLSARGLPGAEMLAELLTRNDGAAYDDLAPVVSGGVWRPRSDLLCPLVAGAALCDRAAALSDAVSVGPISHPLLLAPFAAGAAGLRGTAFRLTWTGAAVTVGPDAVAIEGDEAAVLARRVDLVRCEPSDAPRQDAAMRAASRAVDPETWSRLEDFAHRTFAPASEASRLAGAGAGLSDND